MNRFVRGLLPLLVLLAAERLVAEEPQAKTPFGDESQRYRAVTTTLSRVSDRVRELETGWVERPKAESGKRLHWRMRSRADAPEERLMDADVEVSMLAYPSVDRAVEYLDGRRSWGFSTRFPDLEKIYDDHVGASGPYEQKPAKYWALNCRRRNIVVWVFAPTPEIAIRFATLVSMELPKPESATE